MMDSFDDICGRVSAIFAEHLNLRVPGRDTDLFDEGILDSLGFVDMLLHLEREFGLKVAPDQLDFDTFRTIRSIAQLAAGDNTGAKNLYEATAPAAE